MTRLSPIGVTMGDPAGIGPEIISKAWNSLRNSDQVFLVVGDPACFPGGQVIAAPREADRVFGSALPVLPQATALAHPVTAGRPQACNAAAVRSAIEDSVKHAVSGQLSAVVTAPIAKSVMYEAGFDFPGHTEFLADLTATTDRKSVV